MGLPDTRSLAGAALRAGCGGRRAAQERRTADSGGSRPARPPASDRAKIPKISEVCVRRAESTLQTLTCLFFRQGARSAGVLINTQ